MTLYVSQSKINTWRLCQRKWWYKYAEQLRRLKKSRPLKWGSIVHSMLEAEAQTGSKQAAFDKLYEIAAAEGKQFREEIEEYGDIEVDLEYVMTEYYEYYKKEPLKFLKVKGRKAEHQFEVEIDDGIVAKGKIDGFVEWRKMVALLEHKNHKDFPNEDHRWRNLQSAVYIRFVEMLGILQLEGTVWNYLRSKAPTRPKILKSGALSEARLDSLPSVVVDTVKQAGLNVKDYAELIKAQEDNRATWFKRVFTPYRKKTVDIIFRDFVTTAREISDHVSKAGPRNIGNHCSWCEYEPLCRAALTGGDVDYIIEKEFTTDEEDTYETASAGE